VDVDFIEQSNMPTTVVIQSAAARWGSSLWGQGKWSPSNTVIRQWGGTASWPGRWLSGKLKIVSAEVTAQWIGCVIRFEVGSGL
jgi:hypothetical protein